MNIKQKLTDIQLLIKNDRKYQAVAIGLGLAVLFLLFYGGEPNRRPRQVRQKVEKGPQSGTDETAEDIQIAFQHSIIDNQEQIEAMTKELKELRKASEEQEARAAQIFKAIIDRMTEAEVASQASGYSPDSGPAPYDYPDEYAPEEATPMAHMAPAEMEEFGNLAPADAVPPPPPPPERDAFIGSGDSVRIKLLSGVHAPTDGTPYPVVVKAISNVSGPDGSALPIGEARLLVAAQGSLSDQRVLFRLDRMSLRLPSGRRKEFRVDGWIVGEDGMRGMPGILLDPLGKYIGGAAITGGIAGLGQGIADSESRTVTDGDTSSRYVTGDVAKYAGGQALAGTANEWSALLRERIRELIPHIEIYSGREATAVFSQPVIVTDLYEALEEDDYTFVSLD